MLSQFTSGMRGFPGQVVDDLGDRRARQEDLGDAARLQLRNVLLRDDAAGDDADVAGAALVEQAPQLRQQRAGARPTGCSPRSSRRPPRSRRAPPPRWFGAGRCRSPPCRHRAGRARPRGRPRRARRARPWRSARESSGGAAPATSVHSSESVIRSRSMARSCRTGAARSRRSRPRWRRRAPRRARPAPRCGPRRRRGRPRRAPPSPAPGRGWP